MTTPPIVDAIRTNLFFGQVIGLSELFTVSDPDGDEIESYLLTDNGFGFGNFIITAQGADPIQVIPAFFPTVIAAEDIDRVVYIAPNSLDTVTTFGPTFGDTGPNFETFSIQAFDGEDLSNLSTNFISVGNSPPRINAVTSLVPINGTLAFEEMFSGFDVESDNNQLSFRIRDNGSRFNSDGVDTSGFFLLNGQRLAPNVFHEVLPGQVDSLVYVGGTIEATESFTIIASDGILSGAQSTQNVTTGNSRPEIVASNRTVTANSRTAASNLFSVSDADGDEAVRFVIADLTTDPSSGFWELNGQRQVSGEFFTIEGAELVSLFFVGAQQGPAIDNVAVQVFDGFSFSELNRFAAVTSGPSIITPTGVDVATNQSIAASELFTVSDPDGDAPQFYLFLDQRSNANGGHFLFNGVRQQSDTFFRVNADELDQLVYRGATTSQSENIFVQVFDGNDFSALTNFAVQSTSPPTVSVADASVRRDGLIDVAPLVTFNDPDGDAATSFIIQDREQSPLTGQFELDGNRFPQGATFSVTAAEFARLQYRGGTFGPHSEQLSIAASDGTTFSPTTNFQITTLENTAAPTIFANGITARVGTVIDFQTLFSFSDPDGDPLQTVGFFDTGSFANSGFFSIDGVRQPSNQFIEVDIDLVTAGRVDYTVATVSSNEVFRIFGTDGQRQSVLSSNVSQAITTPVITATENDISLDTTERQLVTSLIDITGAPADRYQIFDENSSATSGRLELDGNFLPQGVVFTLTPAEFERLNFVGAVVDTGRQLDPILVRGESAVSGFSEWTRVNVNTDQIGLTPVPILDPTLQFQPIRGESATAPTIITYSFIDGGNQSGAGSVANPQSPPLPDYYLTGGGATGLIPQVQANGTLALNNIQRGAVRTALEGIESFANIQFVETASVDDAQITYGSFNTTAAVQTLFGNATDDAQGNGNINNGIGEERGDVFFGSIPFDPRVLGDVSFGSAFFEAAIVGTLNSLNASITSTLSIFNNFQYNTIRSGNSGGINDPFPAYPGEPSTLQLYDAIAIQGQYGANPNFNSDDNQYRFTEANQQLLYDAGGRDTINLTTHTTAETIDLRQGQFSSLFGVPQSVRLSYGTVIENARGGSGSDTITGNETENFLFGNAGNDIITGGGGNDALYGGNGSDIYRWSLGDGRDLIIEQNTLTSTTVQSNSLDIVEFRDPSGDLDSLEDDFTFRRFGDDLRIDLTFNQGQGQGTVTLRDFANEDSRVERLRLFDPNGLQIAEVDLNSIFTAATSQPQRFQITSTTPLNPANPALGNLSLASPI